MTNTNEEIHRHIQAHMERTERIQQEIKESLTVKEALHRRNIATRVLLEEFGYVDGSLLEQVIAYLEQQEVQHPHKATIQITEIDL